MTTRNFVKHSVIRPGARHGSIIEVPEQEVLSAGKFQRLSPSTFILDIPGSTEVLAIVHGTMCTEISTPKDPFDALTGAAIGGPKRFARGPQIKAAVRYSKYLELTDAPATAKGTFRFLDPGTLELTLESGATVLVLIARGYLYPEEKPTVSVIGGCVGATVLTPGSEDAEETPAAPLDPPMAATQKK